MSRVEIRFALARVGQALKEPEAFACDWNAGRIRYPAAVWCALLLTAVFGTMTYGMTVVPSSRN